MDVMQLGSSGPRRVTLHDLLHERPGGSLSGPAVPAGPVDRLHYPNDLDILETEEGAVVYFTDSGNIAPAMNAEGYFDTLWGYILTSLQVLDLLCLRPCRLESALWAGALWPRKRHSSSSPVRIGRNTGWEGGEAAVLQLQDSQHPGDDTRQQQLL